MRLVAKILVAVCVILSFSDYSSKAYLQVVLIFSKRSDIQQNVPGFVFREVVWEFPDETRNIAKPFAVMAMTGYTRPT